MTFLELQTAVYDDLSVLTADVFYTSAYIKRAINRAYKMIAGLHPWPHTEKAMRRSTEINQEYYNIPENFKIDSIFRLEVDDEEYEQLNWNDYKKYKADNGSNATDKVFSTFRNQYFINPTPTSNGSNNISIWGQEIPDDLSADGDTTAFQGEAEIEEQMVELTIALCLMKGRGTNYTRGIDRRSTAITFIEAIYDTINRRQALNNTNNTSMFPWKPTLPKGGATRQARFTRY